MTITKKEEQNKKISEAMKLSWERRKAEAEALGVPLTVKRKTTVNRRGKASGAPSRRGYIRSLLETNPQLSTEEIISLWNENEPRAKEFPMTNTHVYGARYELANENREGKSSHGISTANGRTRASFIRETLEQHPNLTPSEIVALWYENGTDIPMKPEHVHSVKSSLTVKAKCS